MAPPYISGSWSYPSARPWEPGVAICQYSAQPVGTQPYGLEPPCTTHAPAPLLIRSNAAQATVPDGSRITSTQPKTAGWRFDPVPAHPIRPAARTPSKLVPRFQPTDTVSRRPSVLTHHQGPPCCPGCGSSPRRKSARPAASIAWIAGAVIGTECSSRQRTIEIKAPSTFPPTIAPCTRKGFNSSGCGGCGRPAGCPLRKARLQKIHPAPLPAGRVGALSSIGSGGHPAQ